MQIVSGVRVEQKRSVVEPHVDWERMRDTGGMGGMWQRNLCGIQVDSGMSRR